MDVFVFTLYRSCVYYLCVSDARQTLEVPQKEKHKKNKDKHKAKKEHRRKKEKVRDLGVPQDQCGVGPVGQLPGVSYTAVEERIWWPSHSSF